MGATCSFRKIEMHCNGLKWIGMKSAQLKWFVMIWNGLKWYLHKMWDFPAVLWQIQMVWNGISLIFGADVITIHFKPLQTISIEQIPFQFISNHYKPFQLSRFHFNPFQSITIHYKRSKTASGPHAGPLLISPTNLDTRKVPPSITFCLKCICNGLEWVEMIFKRKFDPKAHPPPLGCKFDLWNSLNWNTLTTICKWDFNSFQSISIAISLQFISNHYKPFQSFSYMKGEVNFKREV